MRVTEEYLNLLDNDSQKLSSCQPALVHKSRKFDMTVAGDRIQLARIAARIGIEGLYQYRIHRGNGSGLVRRLRGV